MKHLRHGVAALALCAVAGTASAVTVFGTSSTLTDLGLFGAGTYQLIGTGAISLADRSGTFSSLDPNGVPSPGPVTDPDFTSLNPAGKPFIIYQGNPVYGPAGNNANFGALLGTLTSTPTASNPFSPTANDFFLIGTSKTITLASSGHIYGLVNELYYPNNGGAFNVTVTTVTSAVPEPAQAVLLLAGLGVVGMVGRRRMRKN